MNNTDSAEALIKLARDILTTHQAEAITVLDVKDICNFTDYMLICTANSNRHVQALYEKLMQALKQIACLPLGAEGKESNEWLLVDLGSVVIHIMLKSTREFYQLEKLWGAIDSPLNQPK